MKFNPDTKGAQGGPGGMPLHRRPPTREVPVARVEAASWMRCGVNWLLTFELHGTGQAPGLRIQCH